MPKAIHEHLPPQVRRELKEVGWTKGLELAKIARRDRDLAFVPVIRSIPASRLGASC